MTSYTDLLAYTGHCTHFTKTDLQVCELGGSIQKTFLQLCQLVVVKIPGDQTEVRGCVLHMLTKTRLAASGIAVLIITNRTQSTNCSVKQGSYYTRYTYTQVPRTARLHIATQ